MLPTESRYLTTVAGLFGATEKRTDAMKKLFEACDIVATAARKTGKKGRVRMVIDIEPDKNDELALTFTPDVDYTAPRQSPRKAMVYHDPERHAFTQTDPRQLELLAEQEAERLAREEELREKGIARIGRGDTEGGQVING